MNAVDRAHAVIRIGTSLQGRLAKDILDASADPVERNELLAGTLGLVLRRMARDIPIPVDRQAWLAEIVKMAVEP